MSGNSGSRVPRNCQRQKDTATTIRKYTHSVVTSFVNRHQVIVVGKHHIAIRCFLHVKIGRIVGRKDRTPGQLYLPQRYSPLRHEDDHATLKHQRRLRKSQ